MAGADRLCLRLPTVLTHVIDVGSPVAHWADPSGILLDADSEIVVVVRLRGKLRWSKGNFGSWLVCFYSDCQSQAMDSNTYCILFAHPAMRQLGCKT